MLRGSVLLATLLASCARPVPDATASQDVASPPTPTASASVGTAATPIDAAVLRVVQRIARSPGVTCEIGKQANFHACVQRFGSDGRRFEGFGISARPAKGAAKPGELRVEDVSFGPGGGGGTYVARTPDQAYDVVVGQMGISAEADVSILPSVSELVATVIAEYVASTSGRGVRSNGG